MFRFIGRSFLCIVCLMWSCVFVWWRVLRGLFSTVPATHARTHVVTSARSDLVVGVRAHHSEHVLKRGIPALTSAKRPLLAVVVAILVCHGSASAVTIEEIVAGLDRCADNLSDIQCIIERHDLDAETTGQIVVHRVGELVNVEGRLIFCGTFEGRSWAAGREEGSEGDYEWSPENYQPQFDPTTYMAYLSPLLVSYQPKSPSGFPPDARGQLKSSTNTVSLTHKDGMVISHCKTKHVEGVAPIENWYWHNPDADFRIERWEFDSFALGKQRNEITYVNATSPIPRLVEVYGYDDHHVQYRIINPIKCTWGPSEFHPINFAHQISEMPVELAPSIATIDGRVAGTRVALCIVLAVVAFFLYTATKVRL